MRITAQLIDGAHRRPHLGRSLRSRPDRHFRHSGRDFEGDRRSAEGQTAARLRRRRSSIAGRPNADAYNLYLMARQLWVAGNYGDVRRDEIVIRTCQPCDRSRSAITPRHGRCLPSPKPACATITGATSMTGWPPPKKHLRLNPVTCRGLQRSRTPYCRAGRFRSRGGGDRRGAGARSEQLGGQPRGRAVIDAASPASRKLVGITCWLRRSTKTTSIPCMMLLTCYKA